MQLSWIKDIVTKIEVMTLFVSVVSQLAEYFLNDILLTLTKFYEAVLPESVTVGYSNQANRKQQKKVIVLFSVIAYQTNGQSKSMKLRWQSQLHSLCSYVSNDLSFFKNDPNGETPFSLSVFFNDNMSMLVTKRLLQLMRRDFFLFEVLDRIQLTFSPKWNENLWGVFFFLIDGQFHLNHILCSHDMSQLQQR